MSKITTCWSVNTNHLWRRSFDPNHLSTSDLTNLGSQIVLQTYILSCLQHLTQPRKGATRPFELLYAWNRVWDFCKLCILKKKTCPSGASTSCVGKTMRCRSRNRSTNLIMCAVLPDSAAPTFDSTDCRNEFEVLLSNACALNRGTSLFRPISSPCGKQHWISDSEWRQHSTPYFILSLIFCQTLGHLFVRAFKSKLMLDEFI